MTTTPIKGLMNRPTVVRTVRTTERIKDCIVDVVYACAVKE